MEKRWYVIEGNENLTSWSDKKEAGEVFHSEAKAKAQARVLARNSPGETIYVCRATWTIRCHVGRPEEVRS